MLLNDGKLGLIDMGQVKRISLEERIIFAKLIIAHARRDKEEVVRLHFDEVGTVTKYKNKEIMISRWISCGLTWVLARYKIKCRFK